MTNVKGNTNLIPWSYQAIPNKAKVAHSTKTQDLHDLIHAPLNYLNIILEIKYLHQAFIKKDDIKQSEMKRIPTSLKKNIDSD